MVPGTMTTQSEGGGPGGHHGSPRVRTVIPPEASASASTSAGGFILGAQTRSSSASQQAWERYTSVVLAAGSSSKAPSRASLAAGPTTSAPLSEGSADEGDTEMCHQTPYPEDSFMAEPTPLRLVGNYGVAEQDVEAIAAALLTATTWFQTTSCRPDVFADMFIAPKLKKRIFQLAQAADRHPIFQADAGLAKVEAEMDTICLPAAPGPPALALPAPMVQDPPPARPVDRKGKAPIRTAPRPQPIRLVVAFQRPPPPINLASQPRKSFAVAVRNTKGPVKAAAPVIQPAAAQPAAGPSRPETLQKWRHVPSFTAPGPTRRQVLVSFGKGLAPNLDIARLHNAVNQALTTAHAKVAVLSLGPAYDGYSLTTSQVANVKDLEIIHGAVAPLLPTGLQYWVGLPTSMSFIKIVDVPYYSNLVNKVKTTVAEVKAAIAASPLAENFKYAAEPRIVCNSDASTTAKVYINIWDSQAGTRARGIIDKPLLFGTRSCYVRAATANAGAPLCQRCWRWGHTIGGCKAPQLRCSHCSGPHKSESHPHACGLCKGNLKAKPPVPPTAADQPCPHPARCCNCRERHPATDRKCPFWRHHYDPQWINAKYAKVRVHRAHGQINSNNQNIA